MGLLEGSVRCSDRNGWICVQPFTEGTNGCGQRPQRPGRHDHSANAAGIAVS